MYAIIDAALNNARTVLMILVFILISGTIAYKDMPKESDPDVPIPVLYISINHEGISPEDAERLLVRPMEKELRAIEGIKEMTAIASEGHASITMEFDAGFDSDSALRDVLQKVDIAKSKLPDKTDEPTVNEINAALFPILLVTLSGDIPERTLLALARDMKDGIESIPEVLEVKIAGDREEVLDVVIEPLLLESYQLSFEEVLRSFNNNNQLIAAGALDNGDGRFNVKVPGIFETAEDIYSLPVKVAEQRVVALDEVAKVRRTFKDPENYARIDGQPTLVLEVSKRIGTNIISTIEQVKAVADQVRQRWPENVQVSYLQDKSKDVRNMLTDLQNNVLSAVLLVTILIIATLGLRSATLVGVAIPGSFLLAILALSSMGLTLNIVVLFSLILASGMLIDGAVIVAEYADRKMNEGLSPYESYGLAAKRMAWPVIGSTATTLAVFVPLLFWPGVLGEFMKYLPMTVIAVLSASLLMALVFMPTLGALIGKSSPIKVPDYDTISLSKIRGFTGLYMRTMKILLYAPWLVLITAIAILIGVNMAYSEYGHGVEFFPEIEPETAVVYVRARGDLSVDERDALVKVVEQRLLNLAEIDNLYANSGLISNDNAPADTIGALQLGFVDWQRRRPARDIFADIRERVADIAGIQIEIRKQQDGPSQGKPIQLEVSADDNRLLVPAVEQITTYMKKLPGLVDIEDNRPLPGIDWRINVDREQAGRFGADVALVGSGVQLITNGILVGEYRPDDADEELDIRIRFPEHYRNLDQLDQLRLQTPNGLVPISLFVTRDAQQSTGTLYRSDERRILKIQADVHDGVLVNEQLQHLHHWIGSGVLPPQVSVTFKGEDKDQREAQDFLAKAFFSAMFIVAIILVAQFNNFYQTLLILSAVIMSTIGVLLGLLITQQPFGIVMCGIGVIALAGIVVNNNIVLIDTFNILHQQGMSAHEAVLRTCAQRLRPVMLTTVTTILGLIPMVFRINIDLFTREINIGAPSTQWWTQLATSIAGGLTFATLLTLVLTPCLLYLGNRSKDKQRVETVAAIPKVDPFMAQMTHPAKRI